ncbi:hypothetical protein Poli38472_012169 [Pythium oligandrum]|uniref:Uncharacterized protein n=1 Tax=Pythium oligandrum TaxID=41045 RepID=A0A8K1CQC7_PYTOL|nr:hypothetical protein Poli38472_012169 [Pythium oligandrum]|eukprot:TMW67053.1 hypothetical protein Poli38472_012169 [Pythium oligandrum]
MAFCAAWASLFRQSDGSTSPVKLGINFVTASASHAQLAGLELQQDLAGLGIAGVVWNCARVLVEFFQRNPELLDHKQVLELGAGTGAVGLALAKTTKLQSVLLTDLEDVVELTKTNVSTTAQVDSTVSVLVEQGRLEARTYRWGSTIDNWMLDCDVVVCSDCLYEANVYADLLKSLITITHQKSHCAVYVAYKQRHPEQERSFFSKAAQCFDISVWSDQDDTPLCLHEDRIFICRFKRFAEAEENNHDDDN